MVISKIQVSDPGPFWPSCLKFCLLAESSAFHKQAIVFIPLLSPPVIYFWFYNLLYRLTLHAQVPNFRRTLQGYSN